MTTDEERRISDWLHRSAPYPPHGVTVDALKTRSSSIHRRLRIGATRPWGPVLSGVAAGIAVAGITLGFTALHTGPSTPPATTTTSSAVTGQATPVIPGPVPIGPPMPTSVIGTTPSKPPIMTPTKPPVSTSVRTGVDGPWQPVLISRQLVDDISIQTDGTDLYAELFAQNGSGRTLVRVDPVTGAVLAHRTNLHFSHAVIGGAALWTAAARADHTVQLVRYNLKTLRPLRALAYPSTLRVDSGEEPVLTADTARRRVYLGTGHTVTVFNAHNGQVLRQLTLPGGIITGLAVNPDATTLYAGQHSGPQANGYNNGPVNLTSYALPSGRLTRTAPAPHSFAAATDLLATAGGVFAMGGSGAGHPEQTYFFPAGDLRRSVPVNDGGGGFSPTPHAAGNSVYTGGPNAVTCSDPATGNARATTALPSAAFYTGIVGVRGEFFTGYQGDTTIGVVRVTPPTQCTR